MTKLIEACKRIRFELNVYAEINEISREYSERGLNMSDAAYAAFDKLINKQIPQAEGDYILRSIRAVSYEMAHYVGDGNPVAGLVKVALATYFRLW